MLLLNGVVVGSLLGAGIGLVKYLAKPYNQITAMTFWLVGSLSEVSAKRHGAAAASGGTQAPGKLLALRWNLNVML